MKRPLLTLFLLTALCIFLFYPRKYQPDPVFPQGKYYPVTVQGQLLTYSRQTSSLSLTLTDCQIRHKGQTYHCARLLVTAPEDTSSTLLQVDSLLSVAGDLSSFQPARNPGNFDWRAYYLARHISYRVYADTITVVEQRSAPLRQMVLDLQWYLSSCLQQLCSDDPDTAALLTALLLGDKTMLEEDTEAKYEDGGILHILTVSGLHVSVLGGAVAALGKKLYLPPWMRGLLSSLLVFFYYQLCGSGLSAGRAVVMFVCLTIAPLLGRTYDSLSALSLAGLLLLWDSPLLLFQSSFQLSFGAILGIQLVCPAFLPQKDSETHRNMMFKATDKTTVTQKMVSHIHTTIHSVSSSFCFGLGVQLTLLPITLYHFFRYPLYGIFLNLLVLPLTTPLFLFGAAGLTISAALPPLLSWLAQLWGTAATTVSGLPLGLSLGRWLLLPCQMILSLYDWVCDIALSLPGASSLLGRPTSVRIFFYYVVLVLFCVWRTHTVKINSDQKSVSIPPHSAQRSLLSQPKYLLRRALTLLLPLLLLPVLLLPLPSQTLSVTFLDVGQGDCAFLRTPQGTTILIDCGSSDIRNVAANRLIPFLESQAIDTLDYVFLSHTDADHVNGVTAWLESGYSVGTVILPELDDSLTQEASYQNLLTTLASYPVSVLYFHEGMTWQANELTLTALAPVDPTVRASAVYSDLNTASQVLLAEYQGIRILFTGDCEQEGETLLLAQLAERGLTCHILKAGHHGSANATGQAFLQQLQPQAVVVSCGIRNQYGHPHPAMLARVKQQGSSCHVTASCGAVTVTIGDGQARLETFLPAGALFYR